MSPVTLQSFTSILLSTNNMPGTVPSAEIYQWGNRQRLCLLRYSILIRELDKKPCKLHTLRGRYTYQREKARKRSAGGGSGQKGSSFTYYGRRRTKKMTLKQRLEGDKGIWESVPHKRNNKCKGPGCSMRQCHRNAMSKGMVRNEVTDIKRELENIGTYRLLEVVCFHWVRQEATEGFRSEEDKTWHFNRITLAAILGRL